MRNEYWRGKKMMKHILFIGILILLIVQSYGENRGDWPQLGQDAQHSFFSDISVSDHLEILWQYQLEPTYEHATRELFCVHSSPAAVGDRVYMLGFRRLYCVDFQTGNLLYEVPASSIYPYTPAVADGRIYLAAERTLFQCLDAYTGATLWEKELPNLYMVSPVVDEDTVYVTVDHSSFFHRDLSPCNWMVTEWSTLLAMDSETGTVKWSYQVTDSSVSVMRGIGFPILADDTVIFYANHYKDEKDHDADLKKSSLICLDAHTGTLKWNREGILLSSSRDPGGLNPFWMAYYDSKIYIGSQKYVVCQYLRKYILLYYNEAVEKVCVQKFYVRGG
jgi:outer membrane protein assembly factor BamB